MTPNQLKDATGCSSLNAVKWAPALTAAMAEFNIDTPRRQAAFLAQVAHESALFTRLIENLNYGAQALLEKFPRHFNTVDAERYARNQVRIANRLYANRMGNGDEASGDGWKFRGRGPIQITGRTNYLLFGRELGVDLLAAPDQLLEVELGARASACFWKEQGLNQLADAGNFDGITGRINGGQIGREDRRKLWQQASVSLEGTTNV